MSLTAIHTNYLQVTGKLGSLTAINVGRTYQNGVCLSFRGKDCT